MKFCQNCGKKIPSSATFCSYCGAKQPQQNVQQAPQHIQPQHMPANHHRIHISKTLVAIVVIIIVALCGLGYHHHEHGLDNADLTTTLHSHDWNLTDGHKKVGNATFDGNNSMIVDHQETMPINVHNNYLTMISRNGNGHENMKLIKRNGDNYVFKPVNGEADGHKLTIHAHYMAIGKKRVDFVGKNDIKYHGHVYHDPDMRYAMHEWGLTQK